MIPFTWNTQNLYEISRTGKFIEKWNTLVVAWGWEAGYGGYGATANGARLGWWKCSKIRLWWWLHNSVNILKTTELYTLVVWLCRAACGILVPRAGMEPAPPAVKAWSLNHRTTKEVPELYTLNWWTFWYANYISIKLLKNLKEMTISFTLTCGILWFFTSKYHTYTFIKLNIRSPLYNILTLWCVFFLLNYFNPEILTISFF